MHGLYLYAIAESAPALPETFRGLGGYPVFFLVRGGLAAVVSRSPLRSWAPDEAHLTCHEAVVEEVMASRAVLPARFNSVFPTAGGVVSFLGKRSEALQRRLAQVKGKVEMGLRVLWEPGVCSAGDGSGELPPGEGPGARYLQERLKAERLREGLRERGMRPVQQIQAALSPVVAESWIRQCPTERLLLTGAYLVEQTRVEVFETEVAGLQARLRHLRFLCSGPWPPYHFVGDGAEDEQGRLGE